MGMLLPRAGEDGGGSSPGRGGGFDVFFQPVPNLPSVRVGDYGPSLPTS